MLRSVCSRLLTAPLLAPILHRLNTAPMGKRKLVMAAETPSTPTLVSSVDAEIVLLRGKKVRATRVRQSISSTSVDSKILPLPANSPKMHRKVKREHYIDEAVIIDDVSKRLFESEGAVKADSAVVVLGSGKMEVVLRGDENAGEPLSGPPGGGEWSSLGVGRDELDLSLTLPTGQTFR